MKLNYTLALLALFAPGASASTITIESAANVAQAQADAAAWSGGAPALIESFEPSLGSPGPYSNLLTAAGVFSVLPGSLPGDPVQSNGTKTNEFTILNASDSPFSGRYATDGTQWLDSNDITQIRLESYYENIWFLLTDVNDVDGVLTLRTGDGTLASFPAHQPDGNLWFVGITDLNVNLDFLNSSRNDGWGIDSIGAIATPEPEEMHLLLIGLGVFMLALKLKRLRAQ